MVREWEEREIGPRALLIAISGKLRGSRARQLGEVLARIASRTDGQLVQRVVLDLRSVVSIDSLGTAAFDEALELGLKLDIVLRKGFELDDGRQATELTQRGLRVHPSLESALSSRRSVRRVVPLGV